MEEQYLYLNYNGNKNGKYGIRLTANSFSYY